MEQCNNKKNIYCLKNAEILISKNMTIRIWQEHDNMIIILNIKKMVIKTETYH